MARPPSDIRPRLLIAARNRFLTDGVEGASLRRICRDARTSLGMVYYYFKTKDDLFFAVVDETYDRFLTDLSVTLANDAPVPSRLARLFDRVGNLTEDELKMLRLVLAEFLNASPRVNRLIERFRRGHFALLLDLVNQGVKTGVFKRDLPLPVLLVALGALVFPAQVLLRLAGERLALPAPKAGVPQALASILLHGIGVKKTAATAKT